MPRPPTTIHSLPDELLLSIAAHFTHLNRNTDLANLALVSQRWRPIAQEWLLKEPSFKLTYIDQYMWELAQHPHLLAQVRSLEISSTSEARVRRCERGISVKEYLPVTAPDRLVSGSRKALFEKCTAVIAHFARKERHREKWLAALHDDVVPALLGVLICCLPGLHELKLGNAWLMDFPLFSTMLSPSAQTHPVHPADWKHHSFLAGALGRILPRLAVLELPADLTAMYVPGRANTLFDLRAFDALTQIGVTMKALTGFGLGLRTVPPNPQDVFPRTLEVLRISEASGTTGSFLNNLCLVKKNTLYFPSLRRVEVFFLESTQRTIADSLLHRAPHPIRDVRTMFKDAGLELYLYFPPWELKTWEAGGTPWRLRSEEGGLTRGVQRCYKKAKAAGVFLDMLQPVLEAEWDADGDVVMRQRRGLIFAFAQSDVPLYVAGMYGKKRC